MYSSILEEEVSQVSEDRLITTMYLICSRVLFNSSHLDKIASHSPFKKKATQMISLPLDLAPIDLFVFSSDAYSFPQTRRYYTTVIEWRFVELSSSVF